MSLFKFLLVFLILGSFVTLIVCLVAHDIAYRPVCHPYAISNGVYKYDVDTYTESNGSVSFMYDGQSITMAGNYIIWTSNCSQGEVDAP